MRKIIVSGHIVNNAEIKVTNNGNKFISFRLANNDKNGANNEEKTYWYGVISFNTNLIALQQYLVKGKPIIVTGRYSDRVYEARTGGCEIGRDIYAESVDFFESSANQNAETAPTAAPVNKEQPKTQTTFTPPTTAELKVQQPEAAPVSADDDDDLPF
jgi:single-strand DNA-binding protein